MGSGETTPSMAPVHRALLARLGRAPVRAVLLDTPYGFQENAADITAKAVAYFSTRLGNPIEVASLSRSDVDPLEREAALERLREAEYVFSGPGSPSYALRHWTGTDVPRLLADKLARGGVVVTASAAALTLGRVTVPVYEIYKVGEDPHWLPGLDLLSAFDLPVAVIPHYDNAEGAGHDTRFCFLGERRLSRLEADLPDDTFILGIDEHTSLILDLGTGRVTIRGRGAVTVRRRGRSVVFAAGDDLMLGDLRAAAFGAGEGRASRITSTAATDSADPGDRGPGVSDDRAADYAQGFESALARGDVDAAARNLLALDELATEPRETLRAMVARLASATRDVANRAELVAPLTDALLDIRATARSSGDWAAADAIRDRLHALGLELQDAGETTVVAEPAGHGRRR
jgi:hypothetical protein